MQEGLTTEGTKNSKMEPWRNLTRLAPTTVGLGECHRRGEKGMSFRETQINTDGKIAKARRRERGPEFNHRWTRMDTDSEADALRDANPGGCGILCLK